MSSLVTPDADRKACRTKQAFLGATKRSGIEPRKLCKLDEAVPKRNTVDEGSSCKMVAFLRDLVKSCGSWGSLRNAGCQRIFSNSITFDRLINIFI
jgi:hypothetical protein